MATRAVRTALHVTQDREYRRKLKGAENALQSLSGGARGAASGLASMGPHAAVAVAGVAAVTAGAIAATRALEMTTRAVVALGMRGGDVSAMATAFERIADPSLVSRIGELSGGLLRNADIMSTSTRVLRTNIVQQEEWVEWMEATTRAAQDMGRDVQTSMQAVATAASGGGLESLTQLGVNIFAIRERVQSLGLSMETTEGRAIAMRLAMVQLDQDLGIIDNSAGNLNDAWTQIARTAQNWYDEVARGFAENDRLIAFFEALNDAITEALPDSDSFADTLAELTADLLLLARDGTQAVVSFTQALLVLIEGFRAIDEVLMPLNPATMYERLFGSDTDERLDQLQGALERVSTGLDSTSEAFDGLESSSSRVSRQLEDDLLGDLSLTQSAVRTLENDAADLVDGIVSISASITDFVTRSPTHTLVDELNALAAANRGVATSSEDAAGTLEEEAQALRDLAAALEEAPDWVAEAAAMASGSGGANFQGHASEGGGDGGRGRGGGQSREDLLREAAMAGGQERKAFEVEQQEEQAQRIEEGYQRQLEALQDLMLGLDEMHSEDEASWERWRAFYQEQKELEDEAAEAEKERIEEQIRLEEELQAAQMARIKSAIDNTRKMASAVKGSMGAVISAMEATGVSTETTKKAYGILMVAYNSVMAATDLADMARSIAGQDYFAAAAYGLAMAGHIAAAVQAGAELGGGSAKTPAQGTFTPSQRSEPEDRDQESQGTTINNNYGFGQGNSEIGEAVTNHVLRYQRVDGVRHEAPAFYG